MGASSTVSYEKLCDLLENTGPVNNENKVPLWNRCSGLYMTWLKASNCISGKRKIATLFLQPVQVKSVLFLYLEKVLLIG